MRILLNGVETNNKGAELMLYSILRQIEERYPDAEVLIPQTKIPQGRSYVNTKLNFRLIYKSFFYKVLRKLNAPGILQSLKLPYEWLTEYNPLTDVDYFIDGSGFAFSDKWNINEQTYRLWEYRLNGLKKQGTKIIFLPQAFGPAENIWTKKILQLITKNANIVFPRETVSYNYLVNAACNKEKIRIATDFTSLIEGVVPEKYNHLKGKVAIIPNLRMVDKGVLDRDRYLSIMADFVNCIRQNGRDAYLLNHEGPGDEQICYEIQREIGEIEVITRLNALEVKGLISSSYLCITSRFHGVASALNSCVPCLATSWSHKYEELYKDYGLSDCIIDLTDRAESKKKIKSLLDEDNNRKMREHLKSVKPHIQRQGHEMWNTIWSL